MAVMITNRLIILWSYKIAIFKKFASQNVVHRTKTKKKRFTVFQVNIFPTSHQRIFRIDEDTRIRSFVKKGKFENRFDEI